MGSYELLAFFIGPAVVLGMLVILMVLLRWTFARGRSVVPSRHESPPAEDYLVEAARFANVIEAEYFSCVVSSAGIDSALKVTGGQQTLLVPASKRAAAQELLRRYAL